MTIALSSKPRDSLLTVVPRNHGKTFQRRRLPIRAHWSSDTNTAVVLEQPSTPSSSSSEQILTNLRHSYSRRGGGILKKPPQLTLQMVRRCKLQQPHEVTAVGLQGAKRRRVELDYDSDDDHDSTNRSSTHRQRTIHWNTHCAVVEIPHFGQYSDMQKAQLWNGRRQIRAMARTNTAEYQYDGWTVDRASDEDDFVLIHGERVHPVHAQEQRKQRKRPRLIQRGRSGAVAAV